MTRFIQVNIIKRQHISYIEFFKVICTYILHYETWNILTRAFTCYYLRCTTMGTEVDFWIVPPPAVVWSVWQYRFLPLSSTIGTQLRELLLLRVLSALVVVFSVIPWWNSIELDRDVPNFHLRFGAGRPFWAVQTYLYLIPELSAVVMAGSGPEIKGCSEGTGRKRKLCCKFSIYFYQNLNVEF